MSSIQGDANLLVMAITHYVRFSFESRDKVQLKMVKELGFEQIAIPLVADCEEGPRSSIFATKGCLTADNLLIIFPSASTLPGIWSRSLCIEKGLQAGTNFRARSFLGTMLPFFVKALSLGLGVIVLNPNVNSVRIATSNGGFTKHSIPHNETPDMHVLFVLHVPLIPSSYVWDRIVSHASASNIFILAYSQGGVQAKNLLQSRESEVLRRLRAIALTESSHSLQSELNFGLGSGDSRPIRQFLEQHAINWVSSSLPAGQRLQVPANAALHA